MTLEEYIRMLEMSGGSAGLRGPSGMVTPGYTGESIPPGTPIPHNRLTMTKPVGMTDAQVDYWTGPMAEGRSMNIVPREVTRQFYDPNAINPEADAARQAYGDVAGLRATQNTPLPMGLPSGYGQEEGGMESALPQRPSGTFARGGEEHDPRYGGWDFPYGEEPMGWLKVGTPIKTREVKGFGEVGGGGEGPTRGVEEEEGPSAGFGFSAGALSKASEMIAAANANQDYGKAFTTRMGTRQFQPSMTTPQIDQYASPYLRRRKEEEDFA